MDLETIETRMNEITSLLDSPESNLEDLEKEIRSLKEQKRQILEDIEKRKAEEKEVIESAKVVDEFKEERKNKMDLKDLLKTDAYIDAYVEDIKKNTNKNVRKLFEENGIEFRAVGDIALTTDIVPYPTYLAERINTAWERNDLVRRIPKTYFKGDYKETFELNATGATIHGEGEPASNPEQLVFGVVTIGNQNVKKWLKVTDEVLSLKGRAFLDYLFDEIEYHISKKIEEGVVNTILNAPTMSSSIAIGVEHHTPEAGEKMAVSIVKASGLLAGDARPVLVMSRLMWADAKAEALNANYAYDPFNGYEVIFSEYADKVILLDPSALIINLPDGDNVTIKVDELSLAELDLVKIVGKQMVGLGLVKPYKAVVIDAQSNG